jgi:transcriptional regulator with XRE-family HTH domain
MTVDFRTGEITERPTYSEVRDSIAVAREAGAKFFEQIVWQVEHSAWEVLGYRDWDAMREAEYADMGVVVPRADRPEITSRLRQVGLTQQQIASTLGVGQSTVQRDLNTQTGNEPPSIQTSRGTRPASYTPRPSDAAPAAPVRDRTPDPICERPELEQRADDYLASDQALQDSKYLAALLKAAKTAHEVTGFDPERVARIADDVDRLALDTLASAIADWHRRLNSAGDTGLRVIPGGAR